MPEIIEDPYLCGYLRLNVGQVCKNHRSFSSGLSPKMRAGTQRPRVRGLGAPIGSARWRTTGRHDVRANDIATSRGPSRVMEMTLSIKVGLASMESNSSATL